MSKKIIVVMIAITLLFLSVFAACNKNDDNDEPKVYVDSDEYPFVTDENGEKLLDENGEFIVYVTDENGKFVKDENGEKVTGNQIFEPVSEGNKIEHYGYKIILPEKWTATPVDGDFVNKESGDLFRVNVTEESKYADNYLFAKDAYKKALSEEGVEVLLDENPEYLGVEFEDAFSLTIKNESGVYIVYTFKNSGNLYNIVYMSEDSTVTKEACIEMIKGISFKPYQYYEVITTTETSTATSTTNAE